MVAVEVERRWRVRAHAWLSISLSTAVQENTTILKFASLVIIQRFSRKLAPQLIASLMMMPPVFSPATGLIIPSYFAEICLKLN